MAASYLYMHGEHNRLTRDTNGLPSADDELGGALYRLQNIAKEGVIGNPAGIVYTSLERQ
ncbi:hypothetical protein N7504_008683 [Penicillium tannophilum]|nr:hypothetical protein N7504_008683 [Penicillium tannophilum]